jgi:transcription initiation factor TFIIF subunit alpha
MVRDTSNQYVPRPEVESTLPKSGAGSEYGKEARELARRRKFGYMPKKVSPDDLPWILKSKGNEKEKTKDRQYITYIHLTPTLLLRFFLPIFTPNILISRFIGKKNTIENSCYFVFIKCADGGFEAHPIEDWYSFAPFNTYKTLNEEEAEEEFKRRHKTINKYMIMVNKRKTDGADDDDDEDGPATGAGKKGAAGGKAGAGGGSTAGTSSMRTVDSDDDARGRKTAGNKAKSSYNLSDEEDDDDDTDRAGQKGAKSSGKAGPGGRGGRAGKKPVPKPKKSRKTKNPDDDDDDEIKGREDSDDGDGDGVEIDYSSTDSDMSEEEEEKNEEKYEVKGVDEEEAIKALDKSTDEETDDDEGLTEQGKEYRKLMSKTNEDTEDNEEFDDFFKTGKIGKDEGLKFEIYEEWLLDWLFLF